ncbi:MAG: glycosyltransferase family 2 protein [Sedimentisphaerales bacterium]|nr:glycosyltransferase family 2 protein [Sedimentisphaerales bacterium]
MTIKSQDISVVISTYNAADIILNSLNSINKQTIVPAEIIIVDDGSTDNTNDVVSDFNVQSKSKIVYLFQNNTGCGLAKNHGIDSASNKWISFLDADDIWLPQKIEKAIFLLNKYPDVKILSTNYYINNSGTEGINPNCKFVNNDNTYISDCFTNYTKGIYNLPSTVIASKSLIINAGLFGSYRTGDDTDLWCRIGLLGVPVLYDNTPLTIYSEDSPKNFARKLYLPERITQLNNLYRLAVDKGKEREFFPVARILTLEAINQLNYQKRYSEVAGFLDALELPFTRRFIIEEKLKAGSPRLMGNIIPAYHRLKNMFRG